MNKKITWELKRVSRELALRKLDNATLVAVTNFRHSHSRDRRHVDELIKVAITMHLDQQTLYLPQNIPRAAFSDIVTLRAILSADSIINMAELDSVISITKR